MACGLERATDGRGHGRARARSPRERPPPSTWSRHDVAHGNPGCSRCARRVPRAALARRRRRRAAPERGVAAVVQRPGRHRVGPGAVQARPVPRAPLRQRLVHRDHPQLRLRQLPGRAHRRRGDRRHVAERRGARRRRVPARHGHRALAADALRVHARRVRLHAHGSGPVREPHAREGHPDGKRGTDRRLLSVQLPPGLARLRQQRPRHRLRDHHLRLHARRLLRDRACRCGHGVREPGAVELPRLHAEQSLRPADRRLEPDERRRHGRSRERRGAGLPVVARHSRLGRLGVGRLGHGAVAQRERKRSRRRRTHVGQRPNARPAALRRGRGLGLVDHARPQRRQRARGRARAAVAGRAAHGASAGDRQRAGADPRQRRPRPVEHRVGARHGLRHRRPGAQRALCRGQGRHRLPARRAVGHVSVRGGRAVPDQRVPLLRQRHRVERLEQQRPEHRVRRLRPVPLGARPST